MEGLSGRKTTGNVGDDPSSSKFTWRIVNFSKLTEKKLYSEIFYAGGCKWRVLIFPKGNNVDYLSIYLDVADSTSLPLQWTRDANFSLAVVNQFKKNLTVRKEAQHVFNSRENDWGFTSFIHLSEIRDPALKYLVNDTLIVEAEVHVASVVHPSEKEVVRLESKPPETVVQPPAKEVPSSKEEVVDPKAKVTPPPTVVQTPLTTAPMNQTKEAAPTAAPTNVQEAVKAPPPPPLVTDDTKSLPKDPSSEPINGQKISKILLTEISNRTRSTKSLSSNEMLVSSQAPKPDILQLKKEALRGFFNMPLEAIQQANAFGNIEDIILTLKQHTDNLQEKTILEDLASRLTEFKEVIPNATTIVETAQAHRITLTGKNKELDARLARQQMELSSLEAEFSRVSEEEEKLQAEIQRLITQKEELLSRKNSVAVQLEKANHAASKDLEEWRSLEGEIKQANAEWLGAKEKIALANVRWKLFKEDLGLGKLIFS